MAVSLWGKKKAAPTPPAAANIHSIQILGAGCRSCHQLYENAKAAVQTMGLRVEVQYVTDMETILSYGVMRMPAVVINGQVASSGKVLKPDAVMKLLSAQ